METRANWTDLIPDTGLRISEVVDQGDELYTPGISALLDTSTGMGAQRNFTGKTSFGRAQRFDEGDSVPLLRRDKTYTTKVIYENYGGGVEVTKNQIEDRDFDTELNEIKDLSRTINFSEDESGMQLFNGGFATSQTVNGYKITLYGDGVPTFSTVHPTVVPGGSTQSNASSTGIRFSYDNYEVAHVALTLQQTDNGLPLSLVGKNTLVVPINLEREGREFVGSMLMPENANNAINVFKGSTDLVSSQFLDTANGGSNTQWFVIKRERSQFYHEVRQPKRLESDVNILNKTMVATVDARWADYVLDWRGSWGSKGDLAPYAS